MLISFFLDLGVWQKPIILLNLDGFYDQLLGWISVALGYEFISKNSASIITVVESVENLSKAVCESMLLQEQNMGDSFDWPILAPGPGEQLFLLVVDYHLRY